MVQIQHIIYTRLEAAYSPVREGGYQVAYNSPDLVNDDIEYIRKRVRCYEYQGDMQRQRLQFFITPSELAAAVVSIPVNPDKEIIDSKERQGTFIAHAILLTKENFQKIENNPFAIFDSGSEVFIDSVNQLTQCLNGTPSFFAELDA